MMPEKTIKERLTALEINFKWMHAENALIITTLFGVRYGPELMAFILTLL